MKKILLALSLLVLSSSVVVAGETKLPSCAPDWEPLHKDVRLSNGELQNLGDPGSSSDTNFIGVVTSASRPSLEVQFGYVYRGEHTIGDPQSGGLNRCTRFHFNPKAHNGADIAVQLVNPSNNDRAVVTIWRE